MCGRYAIGEGERPEEMIRIMEAIGQKKTPDGLKTAGEIFPTDIVPVLANSRKGDVQPFAMRWGYAFPGGRPLINAKSETAAQKPMFKDGMKQRRCLIPASCYYEWERRDGRKIKHAIRPVQSSMMFMAGLYHLEHHGQVVVPAFVILTREAAEGIRMIHERMPVILPADSARAWLDLSNAAETIIAGSLGNMEYCAMQE